MVYLPLQGVPSSSNVLSRPKSHGKYFVLLNITIFVRQRIYMNNYPHFYDGWKYERVHLGKNCFNSIFFGYTALYINIFTDNQRVRCFFIYACRFSSINANNCKSILSSHVRLILCRHYTREVKRSANKVSPTLSLHIFRLLM